MPDDIRTEDIQLSWFLDNPDLNWTPPASLVEWMANARKDGKAIVYIGFGSITVPNPNAVTQTLVKAVLKSKSRQLIVVQNKALRQPQAVFAQSFQKAGLRG